MNDNKQYSIDPPKQIPSKYTIEGIELLWDQKHPNEDIYYLFLEHGRVTLDKEGFHYQECGSTKTHLLEYVGNDVKIKTVLGILAKKHKKKKLKREWEAKTSNQFFLKIESIAVIEDVQIESIKKNCNWFKFCMCNSCGKEIGPFPIDKDLIDKFIFDDGLPYIAKNEYLLLRQTPIRTLKMGAPRTNWKNNPDIWIIERPRPCVVCEIK